MLPGDAVGCICREGCAGMKGEEQQERGSEEELGEKGGVCPSGWAMPKGPQHSPAKQYSHTDLCSQGFPRVGLGAGAPESSSLRWFCVPKVRGPLEGLQYHLLPCASSQQGENGWR